MSKSNANESLVKFSILSTLVGMFVASLVLAVSVGLIERQPREVQKISQLALGVAASIGLVAFVAICFWRRRIEESSGKLLRLPSPTGWGRGWAVSLFLIIFGILLVSIDAFIPTVSVNIRGNPAFRPRVIIVLLTSVLAVPVVGLVYTSIMLWWQASPLSLEIREKGVIVGGLRFFPWSSRMHFMWQEESVHAFVLNIHIGTRKAIVLVSHSAKQDVDKLLRAHAKNSPIQVSK